MPKKIKRRARLRLVEDKRTCGDCNACCTVVGVEAFGKRRHEDCEHQTPTGCAIHGDHPAECRQWRCVWLDRGLLHDDERPSKIGLVVWPEVTAAGPSFLVDEVWPGAMASPRGQQILRRLEATGWAVVEMGLGRQRMLRVDGQRVAVRHESKGRRWTRDARLAVEI